MQSIEVRDELCTVISGSFIKISEIWIFVLRNLDVSMFLKAQVAHVGFQRCLVDF